MSKKNCPAGPGDPPGASGERKDLSALLPPLALAIVMAATAAPVLASAGGANSNGTGSADGLYYNVYAPDPYVDAGVRSLTHTRAWLGSGHYNGVGFYTADYRSNRHLAYQVSDFFGAYTYVLSNGYAPYDQYGNQNVVSAGMWRTGGGWWHFNWWGPGFNIGVDAYNYSGGNNVESASVGADGWGGCQNAYPAREYWYWIWRNKNNGSWYYFGDTGLFTWGSSPSWSSWGNANWGGTIGVGTYSCP